MAKVMRLPSETRAAAWRILRENHAYGVYLRGVAWLFFVGLAGFWALELTVSVCSLYLLPVVDWAELLDAPKEMRAPLEQLRQLHEAFKQSPPLQVGLVASAGVLAFAYVAGFLGWSGRSMAIANVRGGLSCTHAFSGWGSGWKMARLLVWRGVLVALGLVALVVPGLYLRSRYAVAPYLLVDHPDWSAGRCLRESARLTEGRRLDYFRLDASFLPWHLSAMAMLAMFGVSGMVSGSMLMLLLGLGVYFFRAPYLGTAFALFYEELLDDTEPLPENPEAVGNEPERKLGEDEP